MSNVMEPEQVHGPKLGTKLLKILGGQKVLKVKSIIELPNKIRAGLPIAALEEVTRITALSQDILARQMMVTPRTLQRYRYKKRLSQAASDKLVSLARLYVRAVEVLGTHTDALAWMNHANLTLGDQTPVEMIDTVVGEERVLALLGRIEYGVYS